jgi:NodT family efflux transporter outer membrane factor (OMF) lipoprotein
VGPDYKPVTPDAPAQWHAPLSGGLSKAAVDEASLGQWWRNLGDETLNRLVARAIAGNLDLKLAAARIREARAQRGISQAAFFPTLSAGEAALRVRDSLATGHGTEGEIYSAEFDAGWEVDLFGGVRRSVEAATAALEASHENLRNVQVSLTAEVALNYADVRTFQARIAAAKANIRIQEASYELNQSRYAAGLIGELAAQQALYNLQTTRALMPTLQTGHTAALNRLCILLGEKSGALDEELADPRDLAAPPLEVAVGIPAEAMRRRPDIRRAERNLAAQTARIGVATAELYPKLRLIGTIGLEALKNYELFRWENRFWSFGPTFSWRLFDGNAVRRNIEVQDARQEQALIAYQATVLNALAEVENGLTAYAQEQLRYDALSQAAAAAQRALALSDERYRAGLVDYGSVLEASRTVQSLQDSMAVSKGAVTAGLLRLYKALGGGWRVEGREDPWR